MKRLSVLLLLLLPAMASAQLFEEIPIDRPATHRCVYKDTLVAAADGSMLVTQLYMPDTVPV